MNNKQIYLVDDDPLIRESLAWFFQNASLPLLTFASAQAFLQSINLQQVGCVILDICMPELDGITLQKKLNQANSTLGIVFLSGNADVPTTSKAFKQGAIDLLQKPVEPEILLTSVEQALLYSEKCYATYQHQQAIQQKLTQLSIRERQILQCVLQGLANKQIADKLHIALRTVEIHRHNMMQKMACNSVLELSKLLTGVSLELFEK